MASREAIGNSLVTIQFGKGDNLFVIFNLDADHQRGFLRRSGLIAELVEMDSGKPGFSA